MKIDLTKLLLSQCDEIEIDNDLEIPKEFSNGTDIKDISKVKLLGSITDDGENFNLSLNINCILTLTCSVSLKDVKYPINIDIDEILSQNSNNIEDFYKIINNSIDLLPIIWQNILLEVPIRVVSPDIEEENIYGDGWKFITKEEENKEIDPRLEKLKDFLSE